MTRNQHAPLWGIVLGILPALFLIVDLSLGEVLPAFYQQNAALLRPLLAVGVLLVYGGVAHFEGEIPLWLLPGLGIAVMGIAVGGFDMIARATYSPIDPEITGRFGEFGPALYIALAVALIAWGGRFATRRFGPWAVLLPLALLIMLPIVIIQPVPVVLYALMGSDAAVLAVQMLILVPALVVLPIAALYTTQLVRLRWLIIGGAALVFEVAALVEPLQFVLVRSSTELAPHTFDGGGGGIFAYNQMVALVNVAVVAGVVLLYEWLWETAPDHASTQQEAPSP
jgi:hypothetical protein